MPSSAIAAVLIVVGLAFFFVSLGFESDSIGGFVGAIVTYFIAVFIVFVVFAIASSGRDPQLERYEKQWYCYKCGRTFYEPDVDVDPARSAELHSFPEGYRDHERDGPQQLSAHSSRYPMYAERIIEPIQRAKSQTERDTRGLLTIRSRSSPSGHFDPAVPTPLDLGLVSRLASLGYLHWEAETDRFRLAEASDKG